MHGLVDALCKTYTPAQAKGALVVNDSTGIAGRAHITHCCWRFCWLRWLCLCGVQAALKAFDDDHNGSLDHNEFERFAKSLMKSGGCAHRQQ